MKLVLAAAVFALMVSVGMSLKLRELIAHWRALTWDQWLRLLLATFILPSAAALVLARIFPVNLGETAGLFLVGATPGAPLLTRNLARRGFDMQVAASYQVWGAMLTPLMLPLLVYGAAKLYSRTIWIPPRVVLWQIAEKEFVPLLAGIMLIHFAPAFCRKAQPKVNMIGNAVLMLVFALLLWKMGPELKVVTPWTILAVLLLVIASVGSMYLLLRTDAVRVRTLAVSNANRHVGLALLLSGRYTRNHFALPVIACYAVAVALLLVIAPRVFRPREAAAKTATA